MCVVEWTGATFSLCTVWKNENWPFFVTNNTVCCYIRMKYEWRARSCYTSLIFLLNKGCWLISRGWNLCRLVCLCGGGGAKEQRRTSSDPLTSISRPPSISPLDFILLLFKLSRNSSCSSATTSSICPSPLPSSPSPPSQLFCPLCLPPQMLITALLKLRRWLFDVKMHRTKLPRVGLQRKWAKCWTCCVMLKLIWGSENSGSHTRGCRVNLRGHEVLKHNQVEKM